MADLRQREAVLERDGRRQQPQSRAVSSKTQAKAARKAFMNCWEDVKEFFVEVNSGLYTKGIIPKKTFLKVRDHHDEDALLPAIERRLSLANSCAEFDTILDLLEAESHCQIVADRLREEYHMALEAGEPGSNGSSDKHTLIIIVTVILAAVLSAVVCSALFPTKYSTRMLREAYELSPILGPEPSQTAPYIEPTFYQVPKPNQVASLHPISLKEVLTVNDGDRILIRGDPGTGKTMLTHAITQKWKEGKILTHCDLFAYRLRWFIKYTSTIELVDILKYNIKYQYKEIADEIYRDNGRNVCFLLDGLDEYESGYADDSNFFYELMLGRVLQKAIVIVTSRNISNLDLLSWNKEYRISLFSDEQRSNYFHEISKQTGKNLTKVLSRHENVWKMCYKPLHAALLVKAFSNNILDKDILTETELFEQITLRIYERDLRNTHAIEKFDKIETLDLLHKFPIVSTLCSLALDGFLATKHSFDYAEVPDELKSTNSSYLIIEPGPQCEGATNCKVYSFSHPSLMHFLAAVHLTTLKGDKPTDLIFKHRYRKFGEAEVWKFFCGLTSSFQLHFEKILSSYWWIEDFTLYQCIYEAQFHTELPEIQSAAHNLIVEHDENNGEIYIQYASLTAYDMQAIGFVASSAPDDWISLTFDYVSFRGDNWLSSLLFSLRISKANFSNFEDLIFLYTRSEINFDTIAAKDNNTEQYLKDFFAHTPKLYQLLLKEVSQSLKQIVLYAPLHCKSIGLSYTHFKASDRLTPYIEHCPNLATLQLTHCGLKDIHFEDMNMSSNEHNGRGLPRELVLSYNDIGDEGAVALASYIRRRFEASPSLHCDLKSLKLRYNHIGGRGLAALLTAVQVCPNLTLFDMSYNKPDSSDPTDTQNMALSSLPEELILKFSGIGDAIVYGLLSVCSESKANSKCRLKKLVLKSNHITSKAFTALIVAAHTCCRNLTFIDLANNTANGSVYDLQYNWVYGVRTKISFFLLDYDTRELVLYMENSDVDDEGAAGLIKAIKNTAIKGHCHCRLKVLDLHINRIGSKQLMHLFTTAHTHCANLTVIDLSYNNGFQEELDYRVGIYGSLTVYLSHSDIKDKEAADFAEHIETYCNLKGLDMSFNQISSLQLVEVFKAAHTFCPTLTVIDLSYNFNREMGLTKKEVRVHHHQKHRLMLYMDHSDIDNKAAVALTDYIRSTAQSSTPCSLSVVDLSSNHISSSHLMDILKALYTFCPNLTMVDLSNNRETDYVDHQWGRKQHHYHQSEVLRIYLDNSIIDSNEVSTVILSVAKSCRNMKLYFYFDDISYEEVSSLVYDTEVCSGSMIVVYIEEDSLVVELLSV